MKVALGVTGGIAAYKAAEIVRLLQDRGIRVQVIMTRAAQEFVRPLTFAALSGEKVITGMFSPGEEHAANIDSAIEHIAVAQSIDALLVAPATADVLAQFAQGIASDFLTTLYLATTAPVVVAPAMNVNMWNHPATQANLEMLRQRGVKIVEPGSGYLACGMTGSGRLAENEVIVAAVLEALGASQDLAGETVLITAGPTREKIDPARYLTNRSSGRMGYAMAEAALRRGARVLLVSGPTALTPPGAAELTRVESAEQMRDAVLNLLPQATIVIKTAAVSDYRAKSASLQKIKRKGPITLELEPTADILQEISRAQAVADCRWLRRGNRERPRKRPPEARSQAPRRHRGQRCLSRRHRFRLRSQRSDHHYSRRSRRSAGNYQVGSCAARARPGRPPAAAAQGAGEGLRKPSLHSIGC